MSIHSLLFVVTLAGLPPDQHMSGRVLDDASGAPIAGAFVAASWSARGADMVGSRTTCTGLQVTKTDGNGEFRVEGGAQSSASVAVFKAGLETRKKAIDKEGRWEIRTGPHIGSVEARQRQYDTFWFLLSCGDPKQAPRKIRAIGEEIDRDFMSLDARRPPYFIKRLDEVEKLKE